MKKNLLKLLIVYTCLFYGQQLVAQQVLNGRITDGEGEPLPGVNILIKGTAKGTITDLDGKYSIEVFMGDVIVISFIGLRTQEIEITEDSFKQLSNTGERIQSVNTREIKKVIPKYYDDPPLNKPVKMDEKPENKTEGVGYLEMNNNRIWRFDGKDNDFGNSVLKGIEYDERMKTYLFNFEKPLRTHREHFEFNSSIALDRVTQLPALQREYTGGIPRNGVFNYTSPVDNNLFQWGPQLSQLEYDGQQSVYYKNGNIVNAGQGTGEHLNTYQPVNYFKTGFRTSNSIEYKYSKYNKYYFARYINNNNSGIMPGTYNLGHSINLGAKTRHIEGNFFLNGFQSKHNLYQANYSRILHAVFTTPPEFDNAGEHSTRQALKNQETYLTSTNNQRSYSSFSAHNPYWLATNDPASGKSNNYGANISYRNVFRYNWRYYAGASFKKENNLNNSGFVSFFDQQNGWYSKKLDDNFNLNTSASLYKEFSINRFRFDNYFRYLFSYNHYRFEKQDYSLNYSLPENLKIGELTGIFEQANKRSSHELVLGHNNESTFRNLPIYYGVSLNVYQSNTCDKIYLLPNAYINFKVFEMDNQIADWFPGRIYFQYSNSISETDFQNRPDHYNTLAFNTIDFISYSELKNVFISDRIKPIKTNTYSAGFELTNIMSSSFGFSFDYFIKENRDAIYPTQNDEYILIENLADVTNKGYEATLSYKKWRYDFGISFSKSSNKVNRLLGNSKNQPIAGFSDVYKSLVEGEEVGVIMGSRYLRTNDGELVIASDGFPLVDSVPGIIGNSRPDWVVIFHNGLKIKGITFEFSLEYKHGGQVWNGTKNVLNYYGASQQAADSRNIKNYIYEGVTIDGQPNTTAVDFSNPNNDLASFRHVRYGYTGVAEDAIEDASWFKLKKLALSYHFKDFDLSKLRISNLKLSIWAENIFTVTPYSGVDPQSALFGYDAAQGLDLFNTPSTRRFGLNLNITF